MEETVSSVRSIGVFVDDVDERYATFRARGLDTTQRPESPIHTAPVDQTWGLA
jgi:hypothetical protein